VFEESSEDSNTPENEDAEEVCVKLTPGKKCMYLDYTGINVENDARIQLVSATGGLIPKNS
jgi:hypothetical protein